MIEKNMLRKRKSKCEDVTQEQINSINKENLFVFNKFMQLNSQLTDETLKQYRSNLGQFFIWNKKELGDKNILDITKIDFLQYIGFLTKSGMSSSAIGLRKSSVSSLNNFIENILSSIDEKYKSFKNFTRGLPSIAKNTTYTKITVTREEFEIMKSKLKEANDKMGYLWTVLAYEIGGRRGELIQLGSYLASKNIPQGKAYLLAKPVRGKGKGESGKPLEFMISEFALNEIKAFIATKGFEGEYIFSRMINGKEVVVSKTYGNTVCERLSEYVGRRINPHLFKATRISDAVHSGMDITSVSKFIGFHNDISTTQKHYIITDETEERDNMFKNIDKK